MNTILPKAQRRKPTTKQIRAYNKWMTSPKSNQINPTLRNTTMGQVQEITRHHMMKLDSRWGYPGCGRTVAPPEPNLVWLVHTDIPKAVH